MLNLRHPAHSLQLNTGGGGLVEAPLLLELEVLQVLGRVVEGERGVSAKMEWELDMHRKFC